MNKLNLNRGVVSVEVGDDEKTPKLDAKKIEIFNGIINESTNNKRIELRWLFHLLLEEAFSRAKKEYYELRRT